MKQFRPGDLVPGCDDAVGHDRYEDLLDRVLTRAQHGHGTAELLDPLADPARPDLRGPLPSG